MKRYIITLVLSVVASAVTLSASAQIRTSYFMEGSYFRTDMNPALAPTRGYIAIPVLSGIGVSLNNNFLSVDNFLYKRDGNVVTGLNGAVSSADFLGHLPEVGKLDLNTQINILSFGGHTKKLFWNFGINVRADVDVALKKDMFRALKTLGNGTYDLSGTRADLSAYAEAYLGFAIPVRDWVSIGFRVKGLVGAMDATVNIDRMYANITDEAVRAEVSGKINGAGIAINQDFTPGASAEFNELLDTNVQNMLKRFKSGGAAIDLGVEFRLLDEHLKVSGAVTDLGFIYWNKSVAMTGSANGYFSYEGIDFDSGETKMDSDFSTISITPEKSYISRLNCSLNLGVEYNILNNHIAFGLLSHTKFCRAFTYSELTASVNFRLGRVFTTTLSHTFLNHNKLGVFGFALNLHPGGLNLFLGTDFIGCSYVRYKAAPIPKTMKSLNVYCGLGFNLGKAKYMKSMQPREKKSSKKAAESIVTE